MTDPYDIRRDLEPGVDEDLVALAERLHRARPVPRPAFRGTLGRHLAVQNSGWLDRSRLRARIATCALAGTLLLFAGTASAAGLGPLG